jgi:hypothetical protein
LKKIVDKPNRAVREIGALRKFVNAPPLGTRRSLLFHKPELMIHPLEKPVYFDTSGGQPRRDRTGLRCTKENRTPGTP